MDVESTMQANEEESCVVHTRHDSIQNIEEVKKQRHLANIRKAFGLISCPLKEKSALVWEIGSGAWS